MTNISFRNNNRPIILGLVLVLFAGTQVNAGNNQLNFFRTEDVRQLKSALENPGPNLQEYINVLQLVADSLMKIGPWSVTFHCCPHPEIDPHDYYSESTYWWPDPKDPKAPYIRKDGVRNPNRFLDHKNDLNMLSQTTLILSMMAYLFEDESYAEKVKENIRIWFINPKTRMNPNAIYAQVIPNSDRKRGVGILDTRRFIYLLEGVQILKVAGYWDRELERDLVAWFSEYLDWLLTSYYGIDERERGNNHSTWYAVQVAVYARYTGRKDVVEDTWKYARDELFSEQIEADGKMPREMERTRSLSYMNFNLDAWAMLGRIAELDGIDFWSLENANGGSLARAVEYVLPFLENPDKWRSKQITPFHLREQLYLVFGGEAINNSHMIELYRSVMSPDIIIDEAILFFINMMLLTGSI